MIFVGIMWLGSFFIPNSFFIVYAQWAIYLAGIYLFVQMVSLIDAFYLWAEFWTKKFDDGNTCYGCLMIFFTLLMYTGTGYILFYSYKIFWISGCFTNKILLIIMTILPIVFTTLVLLRFHPNGSVITSGGISIYGTFLIWTAFISFPNKKANLKCNPVIGSSVSMYIQLASGLIVALICTFYWSLSSKPSKAITEAGVEAIVAEPEEDEEEIERENEANEEKQVRLIDSVQEGGENDYSAYEDGSYLKFHVFMMLFAVYITPLFTNWGNTQYNKQGWEYGDQNKWGPFAIKATITIGSMLLYLWTIVAPQILTNREFDNTAY
jgi:hypothetical protein